MSHDGSGPASHEPLFMTALSDGERQEILSRGVVRQFKSGSALFHENQVADRVLVIRQGFVKLSCFTDDGREIVLAIRGPGDILGELSVVGGGTRSATATALEPVEALAVPATDFAAVMQRSPHITMAMLQTVMHRLRDADRKRVEFASKETMGRVAGRIMELSDRFGAANEGHIDIDFPLTQEELAGWTGCSRDSVVKALQSMRDIGWIETGRRRITVLDPDAIRKRAS
jgi:CRP-like cAMP-binding protein